MEPPSLSNLSTQMNSIMNGGTAVAAPPARLTGVNPWRRAFALMTVLFAIAVLVSIYLGTKKEKAEGKGGAGGKGGASGAPVPRNRLRPRQA